MAKKNLDPNNNFYLFGNLGRDPKLTTIPATSGTIKVYDAILDEKVEREVNRPEINFLTYSVCAGGYDDLPERWIYCVDWEGLAHFARKGDGLQLFGQFETRTYTDRNTGEPKTVRQFVVVGCKIKYLKDRSTQREEAEEPEIDAQLEDEDIAF
jgi:single-stranded DNA-binding protein